MNPGGPAPCTITIHTLRHPDGPSPSNPAYHPDPADSAPSGRPTTAAAAAATRLIASLAQPAATCTTLQPARKRTRISPGRARDLDLDDPVSAAALASCTAIQRCLPYPYLHPPARRSSSSSFSSHSLNPTRQHPARVLYSFLDPLYRPRAAADAAVVDTERVPLSSPLTLRALAPGRRGAWLLPLSGPLPHSVRPPDPDAHDDPDDHLRPSGRVFGLAVPRYRTRAADFRESEREGRAHTAADTIEWSDARVRAVWTFIYRLGRSGGGGDWSRVGVRCSAWYPPSPRGPPTTTTADGADNDTDDDDGAEWPALLRVSCPAHLALALRGLLSQLSVRALVTRRRKKGQRQNGQEEHGDDEEEEEDDVKFLHGRGLLWVDEEGHEVLVA